MNLLKRLLPFLGLLIGAGLIYDGGVFYSRWSAREQADKARVASELAHDRKVVDAMGGGGVKILSFYAVPAVIRRGERTAICYGVAEAKTVKLDPPVDEVWPALTRCIHDSPRKDTEYKFTAADGAGHAVAETIMVKVR